jgi:hypothetical protein
VVGACLHLAGTRPDPALLDALAFRTRRRGPPRQVTSNVTTCAELGSLLGCVNAGSKIRSPIQLACGRFDCTGQTLSVTGDKIAVTVRGASGGCRTRILVAANDSVTSGLFDVSSAAVLRLAAVDIALRGRRPALKTNSAGGVYWTDVTVTGGSVSGAAREGGSGA